jgi:hypothetical protein
MRSKIDSMQIGAKAKEYLKGLLDDLNDHYQDKSDDKLQIKKKYFKEMEKFIKERNEVTYEL